MLLGSYRDYGLLTCRPACCYARHGGATGARQRLEYCPGPAPMVGSVPDGGRRCQVFPPAGVMTGSLLSRGTGSARTRPAGSRNSTARWTSPAAPRRTPPSGRGLCDQADHGSDEVGDRGADVADEVGRLLDRIASPGRGRCGRSRRVRRGSPTLVRSAHCWQGCVSRARAGGTWKRSSGACTTRPCVPPRLPDCG